MSDRVVLTGSVVVSALLGACAFIFPAYCGWFVFIFLIPIFYSVIAYQIHYRFLDGMLWGILFFGQHMYGLLRVILDRAEGKGGMLAWMALILYCALYAGLWFWLATFLALRFKNKCAQITCWLIITFCFFWWIQHGVLWIFGRFEGYPLCNLLLPLTWYPQWLFLLPYFGSYILLLFLLMWTIFISLYFATLKSHYLAAAAIVLLPFMIGWFSGKNNIEMPLYMRHVAVVVPPSPLPHNPLDAAQDIAEQLARCIETNPDTTTIIMPESSYPFPLNEYQDMISLWFNNILSNKITLILGAHRRERQRLYNTCYCIKKSRIIQSYDKKHIIPLIEFLPSHFQILKNLFLNNKEMFSISPKPRNVIKVHKKLILLPYICSEIFFATDKPEGDNISLVCLINDSWFSSDYICRLLYLTACYKAQEWQCDILYISHRIARWICKNGFTIDIKIATARY